MSDHSTQSRKMDRPTARMLARIIKDDVERLIIAQATDDIGAQIAYASSIELAAVLMVNLYEEDK